jgi:ABC-2 type transport system permease protein
MAASYSQMRASSALTKASLLAMMRSPTSVVFSLLFPVIFIIVFGSMVDNTIVQLKIGLAPGCDTSNVIYDAISSISNISIDQTQNPPETVKALQKGRLTAIVDIKEDSTVSPGQRYNVSIISSKSSARQNRLLQILVKDAIVSVNQVMFPGNPSIATVHSSELPGRTYRQIDFILPGQLGFSLLMAGIFGSSFLLFNLRQGLVLKRISATPINRKHLILGEMLSRLVFHIISFIIMVGLGYFVFNFTLVNGFITFLEMFFFSLFGLIIFMSIGFIISSLLQNESSIAPVANTFTLPQILLCGLFFPIENYPHWLQSFCKILPLTFFVDGLRKIAFEGAHIWQVPMELIGLTLWAILTTSICIRFFKWD